MKRIVVFLFALGLTQGIINAQDIHNLTPDSVDGHEFVECYDAKSYRHGMKVDGKLIVPCDFDDVSVRHMIKDGEKVLVIDAYISGSGWRIYSIDGKILISESEGYQFSFLFRVGYLAKWKKVWSSLRKENPVAEISYDLNKNFNHATINLGGSKYAIHYTETCDDPCDVYADNEHDKPVIPRSKGLVITKAVSNDVLGDIFGDYKNCWYDRNGNFLYEQKNGFPTEKDILCKVGNTIYVKTHSNALYGVSDVMGKEILAPEFTKIEIIADKNILYEMNGMQGVMTTAGKHIIPLSRGYTSITWSKTFKCYNFEKYGAKGTCNANGVQTSLTKVATPPTQAPSQPASNNRPQQQQQQPSQGNQPDVKVPAYIPCPTCGGTLHCPTCAGTGSYWSGSDKRRCGVCNGTGVCQSCHGTGTNAVIYY